MCNSHWPFPDKTFDFVVCSHLLEDVRDPITVCRELCRVGKAGYIETPSRIREIFSKGPSLQASMSRYLVDRITARPNVEILTETTVTALEGQDGILEAIRCRSQRSGEELRRAIRHLFLFIGAEPNTEWLSRSGVTLDDKGFVRTDANPRRPLETSLPGVFAIGDVRSGSVKRVAASVGEGAQVVAALHAFLAEAGDKAALPANTGRQ